MTAENVVITIANALRHAGVPHMAVGAFAGIYYGINRTTDDADFVIQAEDLQLAPLRRVLGPEFVIDPQPRIESITMGTYYALTRKDTDFGIDLFLLRDDPHEKLSFSRRRLIAYEAGETFICTAEDYLITKLRWAKTGRRPKDIQDVRMVLAVQLDTIDLAYIRQWCGEHGTLELLEITLRSIPALPP